ncbi:MAG: hypothetical protein KDK70_07465 [Myxococcales bacterium]|nr:hypothetical protein [Myxococcales bacterium]
MPPAAPDAPSPPPSSPWAWGPVAALQAALVGYLVVRDIGAPIFDDGYFFKRFALNALEHGVFAWNLEDGPVHGCTSQAFQLLATLAAAIDPAHYVIVIKALCGLCLVALGVLMTRWCTRAAGSPRGAPIALLALASPLVLTTALTGMETASTLLALALVLMVLVEAPASEVAALLTVLVYLFRPDVALVPALVVLVPALVVHRTLPARYLGALAGLMLVTLGALWAYYGTPLPLSFFMKTAGLRPYGPHVEALALGQKQLHFGATLAFGAPLLWLALHRRDPTNLALLVGALALWAYHLLLTAEIMGYRGRFYVPGLVPLVMAAARADEAFARRGHPRATLGLLLALGLATAVAYTQDWIPTPRDEDLGQLHWASYAGLGLGAAWLLLRPRAAARPWLDALVVGALATGSVLGWKPPMRPAVRSDAVILRVHARQFTTVRGLFDVARCLPEAKNVYHSEMGVTGLVLLRTRVVDLVGILSDHLLRGDDFEAMCERDRPEAIFLPHANYRELNAEIRRSPCFASYRRVVDRSASPLHVREDLAEPFLRCATEVQRWRAR